MEGNIEPHIRVENTTRPYMIVFDSIMFSSYSVVGSSISYSTIKANAIIPLKVPESQKTIYLGDRGIS